MATKSRTGWPACAASVLMRPVLWATALRAVARFAPTRSRFARASEFHGATYARWRMQTAYGDPSAKPSADDFVEYLRWMREMHLILESRSARR